MSSYGLEFTTSNNVTMRMDELSPIIYLGETTSIRNGTRVLSYPDLAGVMVSAFVFPTTQLGNFGGAVTIGVSINAGAGEIRITQNNAGINYPFRVYAVTA